MEPKTPSPRSVVRLALQLHLAVVLGCILQGAVGGRAGEEDDQIAVLQSAANATQKSSACQRLRRMGTAKAVPALASLLGAEETSQAARHALEGLPFPEAGVALCAALPQTTGRVQAGVIDSLGWRREPASVPFLIPFLAAADPEIAIAAATALGRIGGPGAVAALNTVPPEASASLRVAVQGALLECAERSEETSDQTTALGLYGRVLSQPASESIRAAAWRGVMLTDARARPQAVREALAGTDHSLQIVALQLVREVGDGPLLAACLPDWDRLGPEAQLALFQAQVRLGQEALAAARKALASPHAAVRLAALQALADLGDPSTVVVLAQTAVRGQPAEREAAHEALRRVRGPGVREALLAGLDAGEPPERAELLRALGGRGDRAAAAVLLQYADADPAPVRLAALESLRQLAPPDILTPLLGLVANSKSEDRLGPLLQTVSTILETSPDKRGAEGRVLDTVRQASPAERRLLLPLLAELGTPDALTMARGAASDANPELARAAVRVLGQWPNADPAPSLFDLAQATTDATLHALALRGGIGVAAQEPDAAKRLALLERALSSARRAEEKRQALAQLVQTPSPESLEVALEELATPELLDEAGLAAVSIAEKLAPAQPVLADEAAIKVLARCKGPETVRRAWALRLTPAPLGPFLQHWLVSGPYRRAGTEGAQAVFDLAFDPEKPQTRVDWKSAPRAEQVNLAALFPDQVNCVAYLRTQVIAPEDTEALLLMGSDDGLAAWLNGESVHRNNVDRGLVVDQDRAPIRLKKGANELLLKVTQGGGGWGACARIVSREGQPLPGLLVEPLKP